jgi:hypothetical protein
VYARPRAANSHASTLHLSLQSIIATSNAGVTMLDRGIVNIVDVDVSGISRKEFGCVACGAANEYSFPRMSCLPVVGAFRLLRTQQLRG